MSPSEISYANTNTGSKSSKSTAKMSKLSGPSVAGNNGGGLKAGSPEGRPASSRVPTGSDMDTDMMSDQGSPVDPRQVRVAMLTGWSW